MLVELSLVQICQLHKPLHSYFLVTHNFIQPINSFYSSNPFIAFFRFESDVSSSSGSDSEASDEGEKAKKGKKKEKKEKKRKASTEEGASKSKKKKVCFFFNCF